MCTTMDSVRQWLNMINNVQVCYHEVYKNKPLVKVSLYQKKKSYRLFSNS